MAVCISCKKIDVKTQCASCNKSLCDLCRNTVCSWCDGSICLPCSVHCFGCDKETVCEKHCEVCETCNHKYCPVCIEEHLCC